MKKITNARAFCEYARNTLNGLEHINDNECSRLQHEHARLTKQLVSARDGVARVVAELKRKKADLTDQERQLAEKNSRVQSLEREIADTRAEIERLRDKIRNEEQRRSNAVYDLIPFHGLFAGIISGDMKRAIPYYSQIDGIISAVSQDLEAAEDRQRSRNNDIGGLQHQSSLTRRAIHDTKNAIANLERNLASCKQQLVSLDNASKKIGQQITEIHKSRTNLELLRAKYAFLQSDIEVIMDMDESLLIDDCIAGFLEL